MLKGLHHNAYGCCDSEETRKFYEDFLGLPLAASLELSVSKSGRPTEALHTFYRLDDGSYLAFFEERGRQLEYAMRTSQDELIVIDLDDEVP